MTNKIYCFAVSAKRLDTYQPGSIDSVIDNTYHREFIVPPCCRLRPVCTWPTTWCLVPCCSCRSESAFITRWAAADSAPRTSTFWATGIWRSFRSHYPTQCPSSPPSSCSATRLRSTPSALRSSRVMLVLSLATFWQWLYVFPCFTPSEWPVWTRWIKRVYNSIILSNKSMLYPISSYKTSHTVHACQMCGVFTLFEARGVKKTLTSS